MVNPSPPPIQCSLRIDMVLRCKNIHRVTSVYLTWLIQNLSCSYTTQSLLYLPSESDDMLRAILTLIQHFENVMKFQGL
jgi:hypothetical protein